MRQRIEKGVRGHYSYGDKEVRLSIQGKQIVQVAIRFANQSWEKVSNTDFVALDIDWDMKQLFFVPANKDDGYKLSGEKTVRTAAFTVHDAEAWRPFIGDYVLLKDQASGDYYIDLTAEEAA